MERINPNENPAEKVVKSLLIKPSQKPNFNTLPKSNILSQLKSFLPQFKQDTEKIINNPDLAREKMMEVSSDAAPANDKKLIEMNLGLGLFDLAPGQEDAMEKVISQSGDKEMPHFVYFDEENNEDEDEKMEIKKEPKIQEMEQKDETAETDSKKKNRKKAKRKLKRDKLLANMKK